MAKVLQMLEKMGIVETVGGSPEPVAPPAAEVPIETMPAAEPPRPEHRTIPAVTFDETIADAESNPEDYPLSKIYASAGIEAPAHGFTVDKLIEMMDAEEFAALDPPVKAQVITGLLRRLPTGAVDIDDIVDDAARRDRALDAFEAFLSDRVQRTADEVTASNAELQLEIDELSRRNAELMEANRQRLRDEEDRLERWLEKKREEEQRLFEAVQPFVEANPVTREEPADDDR